MFGVHKGFSFETLQPHWLVCYAALFPKPALKLSENPTGFTKLDMVLIDKALESLAQTAG
jgi:hypothetical protein